MPGKIRVSVLARELGITSKEALATLADLGATAKSAVSTVEPEVADQLRAAVTGAPAEAPPAETPPAETPPAEAPQAETPPAETAEAPQAETPPAPAKKAPRKRASKKTAAAAPAEAPSETPAETPADTPAEAPAATPEAGEKPAKKAPRKRASKKTALATAPEPAEPAEPATGAAESGPAETGAEAPAMAAPGVLFMAPSGDEPGGTETTTDAEGAAEGSDPDDVREAAAEQANGARRRRRRGRRGRGGSGAGDQTEQTDQTEHGEAGDGTGESTAPADAQAGESADTDTSGDADTSGEGDSDADAGDGTPSSSSRRRRRRRRAGSGDNADGGDAGGEGDDPPNTVTHVRDGGNKKKSGGGKGGGNGKDDGDDDGVRGVKGSTRLEAKRQRRRDGRDTSRRRAPILTEAEFLARREAVDRVMAVRQNGDRTQIAVLEDDVLVEHYVTRASATSYVGNVYLGRVQNVLPSMEAAFVDIGKGRNGVLYAGEVNWDAAGLEGKSRAIEQALKSGDTVLVQVTKDPIGHKGARLTSQISLPGRFLVYVPGGGMTGISRRLPDTERHRLKAILKKIVPEDAGVIVRTAAEGASEEDLTRDVERLQAQWETIKSKSETKKSAPVLLHGEPDLAIRVVRDVFNEDFKSLVVEGDEAWATVSEYITGVAPDLGERVSRHTKDTDLFHDLRVDEQLMKALDRKVWLPSGGSLVIDRTEAMTVVDVNTGKFVGSGGNLEQTVTRNNLEAAEEIVRQLRLRDVGGIVVIDFIDMVLESNRELVLRRLTECLGRDRTKHQVAEVTSLGLVQMTRKRVGEGLLEAFSEPCEHCKGRGVVVHGEPVDQSEHGGGNGGNNGGGGSDDDRPKGKRRRGRGGNGNGNNGGGNGDEPVDAPPAANDEQRRAASAAIAAIHRAAGSEDGDSSAEVTELATGLVEAVMRVDSQGTAQRVAAASGSETDRGSEPEPATTGSAEAPGPDEQTTAPESQPEPEVQAVDDAADRSAAANGASGGGRRRRRTASRPAGPPVHTD